MNGQWLYVIFTASVCRVLCARSVHLTPGKPCSVCTVSAVLVHLTVLCVHGQLVTVSHYRIV